MVDDDDPEVLDLGVVDEPASTAPTGPAGPVQHGGRALSRRGVLTIAGLAVAGGAAALVRARGSTPPRATPPPSPAPSSAAPSPFRLPPGQVVVTQLPGPVLPGLALDLFGFSDSAVVRVELATGRVTRTSLPTLSDVDLSFVPVRGGVLVHRQDGRPTYVVRDGRSPQPAPAALTSTGPMLPGPDLDHVWVAVDTTPASQLRLVGADGSATGISIGLSAYVGFQPFPDGGGYSLVYGVGGTYWARPEGLVRVTTGTVIAGGAPGWLVVDCDERASCAAGFVDHAGQRRTVPGVLAADVPLTDPSFPFGAIAPDGRTVALYIGDAGRAQRLVLVSLATGRRRPTDLTLVQGSVSQSLAWSPDSRWLFAVDSSARLIGVDAGTGTGTLLVPDDLVPALPVIQSIAVRSAR